MRGGGANDTARAWAHLPPAVCVVVLAPDRSGRVLMVQRAESAVGGMHWTPVTGRVEPGESLEQAARREVREEVGLEVEPFELVWHCPTSLRSHLLHWYLARLTDEEGTLPQVVRAEEEVRDHRWVRPEEVASLEPTFEDTRHFFAEFAERINEVVQHTRSEKRDGRDG